MLSRTIAKEKSTVSWKENEEKAAFLVQREEDECNCGRRCFCDCFPTHVLVRGLQEWVVEVSILKRI